MFASNKVTRVLQKVHTGDCDELQWLKTLPTGSPSGILLAHHGSRRHLLRAQVPSLSSQFNRICIHIVRLQTLSTPWPFHTRAFGLIDPVNPPSKGHIRILAATRCYTKWVEAVGRWRVAWTATTNFIRDSVSYQFGNPNRILSNKSTPLINTYARQLTEEYHVDNVKSSLYYPQWNG